MLCRLRSSAPSVRSARMATMVATEEFPFKGHVSPKAAAPAVIKSNKLEGGVQSISRDTTSAFVSFKFAVVGGSGAESKSTKGAAHFLSKAAFAGSKSISGMKLVNDLEGLGASFQSYADKEKIVYDVAVLADKADQAVGAVLTAIASPPHANYVLEELKAAAELDYVRHAADTSAQLRELVQEAAFGEDSPLGAPRLASKAKKLSVDQVLEYRTARFVRGNLVVAANGISQANLDATLSKHAGVVPAGSAPAVPPSPYKGGEVKVRTDLDGASRLGLAFPVPAGEDGKAYAVLSALVAQALGEQKLCCTPYVQTFRHGGLMGVEAANAQHLEAYINALKAIANKCPDIEAAKQKLTLEHFLALEGHCSSSVLLNAHLRGLSPEAAGDVRGVTAASVSAAAAAALKATPAYAVLGTTAGTPSFSAVTKML